jgi:uncharacterized protein YjiS (DUF1127 family)
MTISTIEIQISVRGPPWVGWPQLRPTIHVWQQRRRQRLALRELDDRLLRDFGITRAAVRGEAAKPFWKT